MNENLKDYFGNIDIYLFDQLLKGRFNSCSKILDIGCGNGRNIIYFLRNGFDVYGIDQDENCISSVQEIASELTGNNHHTHFSVAKAENLPYPDQHFDLVIISAVFHFAKDQQHFEAMLGEAWRVIRPQGYFFARLASDIGIETKVVSVGNGRFQLPDGSERFLVNESMLLFYTTQLKATLFEPIKTTNVQGMRCMTTWCLQK
jgi:ubiquinone/menaquinone biosynthesis C-methylase UbiE